jgi:hypothetical protein
LTSSADLYLWLVRVEHVRGVVCVRQQYDRERELVAGVACLESQHRCTALLQGIRAWCEEARFRGHTRMLAASHRRKRQGRQYLHAWRAVAIWAATKRRRFANVRTLALRNTLCDAFGTWKHSLLTRNRADSFYCRREISRSKQLLHEWVLVSSQLSKAGKLRGLLLGRELVRCLRDWR